ncbi:MAG: biotin--[acetyl-CoA-carboxylase] ligase [Spirochaetae bacterium HGW-Spirochaetae-1]|nr:MAG: biotin--[acetyl-CoA-carboxylase] ligase [Spirochaetae bacterium HGW-Spirochaetae-1]
MGKIILKIPRHEKTVSVEEKASQPDIAQCGMETYEGTPQDCRLIDSTPPSGYPFAHSADQIVPEEITAGLNTGIIGGKLVYLREVTSTQDMAEKLAREGAIEGTTVIAEKQLAGRGRRGRNWISPSGGGIYISLVLRPDINPINIAQVPMAAGVALTKTIEQVTGIQSKIKWPNDIMIGTRKVAGILTEMNCEADRVNYIILGIGINVNTGMQNLPELIRNTATSLREQSGSEVSRMEFIRCLLSQFEDIYKEFIVNGFSPILTQWKQLNNTIGSKVRVFDDTWEISGTAVDIDEDGSLLVETDSGVIKKIISGDVSLRNR